MYNLKNKIKNIFKYTGQNNTKKNLKVFFTKVKIFKNNFFKENPKEKRPEFYMV